jgi:hypothetical protein|tara:strand:+ start:317 stop:835 length:519 start_codon:yes stop_codon:yes gene_type:complete
MAMKITKSQLKQIIKEEILDIMSEGEKPGLWANIRAKKKRMKAGSGEKKAKPGDKDYPETLDIDEQYYHITDATYDDGTVVEDIEFWDDVLEEAEYQGRKVTLNKPMKGDVKKSKVYVKDPKTGNVKKVNFGDPDMKIRKSNPEARKSFRARHKCDQKKPKTSPGYWSCKAW